MKVKFTFEIRIIHKNSLSLTGHHTVSYLEKQGCIYEEQRISSTTKTDNTNMHLKEENFQK